MTDESSPYHSHDEYKCPNDGARLNRVPLTGVEDSYEKDRYITIKLECPECDYTKTKTVQKGFT